MEPRLARGERDGNEEQPLPLAIHERHEQRRREHQQEPGHVRRDRQRIELALEAMTRTGRNDPENEAQERNQSKIERRRAKVMRAHRQKEAEPRTGRDVPENRCNVERDRTAFAHSAWSIAFTRASSTKRAICAGKLARAAIAPASTASAACKARSARAVSVPCANRAAASSSAKRSGRRNASAFFSSSSSACAEAAGIARSASRFFAAARARSRTSFGARSFLQSASTCAESSGHASSAKRTGTEPERRAGQGLSSGKFFLSRPLASRTSNIFSGCSSAKPRENSCQTRSGTR